MSREIRRVPVGWEHPRDERGSLRPLYGEPYSAVRQEWIDGFRQWEAHEHPDWRPGMDWWEWEGDPPQRWTHRPEWPADAVMGWCLYETVSEGTPMSPVFATEAELIDWLTHPQPIGIGRDVVALSPTAAREFVRIGGAPSGVADSRGFRSGMEAFEP